MTVFQLTYKIKHNAHWVLYKNPTDW